MSKKKYPLENQLMDLKIGKELGNANWKQGPKTTKAKAFEEKIYQHLLSLTHVEGRYVGGGDEPQIIVFTHADDCDKESFLKNLAEDIAKLK